jgi:isopentenyl-diphosphate delta-isomerase
MNLVDLNEVEVSPPLNVHWHGGAGFLHSLSPTKLILEGQIPTGTLGLSVHCGANQIPIDLSQSEITPEGRKIKIQFQGESKDIDVLLSLLRKDQHIDLCRKVDVESEKKLTGFENLYFNPVSLPDLNFDEISLEASFLGRRFSLPFLITGRTGGVMRGTEINRRLAIAASELNIPMGVGSQRVALEHPEHADMFNLKRHAPNLFLIGNLGISQLLKGSLDDALRAAEMIKADALAIHINLIQEAIQPEGDRQVSGAVRKIEDLKKRLGVPLIIKEVGSGLDPVTARRLIQAGITALDVGGSGGTSWGWIESLRGKSRLIKELGHEFRDWGIPTAHALAAIRRFDSEVALIATGGMRGGMMAAKALALGANMVGVGLPLFKAAFESEKAVMDILNNWSESLKRVLWATDSKNIGELKGKLSLGRPYAHALSELIQGTNTETKKDDWL